MNLNDFFMKHVDLNFHFKLVRKKLSDMNCIFLCVINPNEFNQVAGLYQTVGILKDNILIHKFIDNMFLRAAKRQKNSVTQN